MKIVITGGSGFIGDHLIPALLGRGHQITVFDHRASRHPVGFVQVHLNGQQLPAEHFEGVDAIIHLAGRSIFGRWNKEVKKQIHESRVLGTRTMVSSLAGVKKRPCVFVSASAVGYYGSRGEEDLDERSTRGDDFLARVCVDWETEARKSEPFGLRSVQVRTAPVLGRGGLLPQLLPLYKWGLGGPLGNGRQWFPWVHIRDMVNIYVRAVEDPAFSGPVNACAPGLVRNVEFSRTLASVLHRPHFLRAPGWLLRIPMGDLAGVVLSSQKVHPGRLEGAGFKFEFPDIPKALEDVVK